MTDFGVIFWTKGSVSKTRVRLKGSQVAKITYEVSNMKIAVTSTGPTLDDMMEARFGRCAYFLIIDLDALEFEAVENPNIALGGGPGIQSAQLMAEKGISTVLTGNCGPNAFQTFGAA